MTSFARLVACQGIPYELHSLNRVFLKAYFPIERESANQSDGLRKALSRPFG